MFFFDKINLSSFIAALLVLLGLILINEITRRNKWISISVYIIMPIILTMTVWPKTAGAGTSSGYWFAWVKTYSALIGVIGFMALRYIKKLENNKFMLLFPGLILSINILEAVYRDFECFSKTGIIENGLYMLGGPWNIINGIAGIINILTITGWGYIRISRNKSKDMVWADQLWFWILAYGIWNISYCYNAISDRSFYAGFILILSCVIAEFFVKKGIWLQHRAQTLAIYTMFTLTFPSFASNSIFAVKSSHKPEALLLLSILSLIMNVSVLIYEIYTIKNNKLNPFKNEIYTKLKSYKKNLKQNKL
ncbi:hypothetical protein C7380_11159 [Oceanotoga teriensis]|uniref:Uncharacterized protein n=1 Tax=Oceanotoga teriensis TaxID=515440 RepID=A0AA45C6A6_9BACT|nr:DUF5692 family protein [Oceanotoga teriensis]PWJ91251.1 hypothetical protein C7380_11159 [Oceanotoga teriensis]